MMISMDSKPTFDRLVKWALVNAVPLRYVDMAKVVVAIQIQLKGP